MGKNFKYKQWSLEEGNVPAQWVPGPVEHGKFLTKVREGDMCVQDLIHYVRLGEKVIGGEVQRLTKLTKC